jgi:anthranilate phosphoribosyltransferase
VVGVYSGELTEPLAQVLAVLGCHSAYAVYGADGLDELSTTGVNKVSSLYDESVTTFALDAEELGLPRASLSDLRGGTPETNASIAEAILSGEAGPRRDVVVLNAAATLVVSGHADSLLDAISASKESIDSGAARTKLRDLVEFSWDVVVG